MSSAIANSQCVLLAACIESVPGARDAENLFRVLGVINLDYLMRNAEQMTGRYSPLYFLASLGAGGLAVSFFMYLMWLTPHAGSPIPHFATLLETWSAGDVVIRSIIAISVAGIAFFAFLHFWLLVWNLRYYRIWSRTPAYDALRASNSETQLLALPLTLAMSVNVGLITGALFVPGLWGVREILFPPAMLAFGVIGVWAIRLFLDFISRVLAEGGFDCAKNNSLGQMLVVFAFSMVGVGFAAGAAMSHVKAVAAISYAGAVFFVTAAVVLGLIKLVLGFRAMMEYKAAEETTPTLWIIIPILTVLGIAIYRLKMSLAHSFGTPVTSGEIFSFLMTIVALQLLFGLIGWSVMKRVRYFERWVSGPERSAGSYALICPGVAFFVSANFLINAGLIKLGLIEAMSLTHFLLYLPLIVLQAVTIKVFIQLNGKLLRDIGERGSDERPGASNFRAA